MLRNLVLGFAVLVTLASLVACAMGVPLVGPLVFGGVLLAGTLGERIVYKRLSPAPPAGNFRPTAERFFDDATGAKVTVWTDPATGERKYVKD